jgi:organic radical activating enzyme
MLDIGIEEISKKIRSGDTKVVLWGADLLGRMAHFAFEQIDINIAAMCDSRKNLHGSSSHGVEIISPETLASTFPKDTFVFITSGFVSPIHESLDKMGFKNIHNCLDLLKTTNFEERNFETHTWGMEEQLASGDASIERSISTYGIRLFEYNESIGSEGFYFQHVDIVVTEKCSMKCQDCSNLMQYYQKPKNTETELLLDSVEKLLSAIDGVSEFRVIGGDPFMNRQVHQVINYLTKMKKVDKVVIYTNGTILPKGENLQCLKHNKILVHVTNYGKLSLKHDQILDLFKQEDVQYISNRVTTWNDCGRIQLVGGTEEELTHRFSNCCAMDIYTLLHGILYRCPFSANAINLKSIPDKVGDRVDLTDFAMGAEELVVSLKKFNKLTPYADACRFCKGRDYSSAEIDAAIQTKNPLPLPALAGKTQ